jgi:hypothetical protein
MSGPERLEKSIYDTRVVASNKRTPRRNGFIDRVQEEAAKPIVLRELIEHLIRARNTYRLADRTGKDRAMVIRVRTLYAYNHGYLQNANASVLSDEDHDLINRIRRDKSIPETEKQQLIKSRIGQGRFRDEVKRIETGCRVTRVRDPEHLRASHIKPWRSSTNEERLDGNNGLLLAPHIDHLFDQGFISFEDDGTLLLSRRLDRKVLRAWGVSPTASCGKFNPQQRAYLDYHRKLFGFSD